MKQFTARARPLRGAVLTFMLALTLLGALLPGAALAAPSGGAAPSAITKPAEWNGGNCSTWYTVQFGDSLSSIAVRFGTSVNALMQANGIWNPNRVLVGQTLCIPGGWNPQPPQPPPSGNCVAWHWVKPGQTLSGIAAWYGVSPWALAQANGIWNWNLIFVGQQLCIPGGGGWHPQPPPPPQPTPASHAGSMPAAALQPLRPAVPATAAAVRSLERRVLQQPRPGSPVDLRAPGSQHCL
jgi:LysM repeat protein